MLDALVAGLLTGLSLIVAIGAQNAFVLRQGLRREHVGSVVLFCAAADAVLIAAGVLGMARALGQSPHLTAAWFLQLTGLSLPHVPFRGAGPALAAVLGGQVPLLFDNLYPSLPQHREGKLRALAVTTQQRNFQAPELPTMAESAPELAKFEVSSWFGVFLPKGVPDPVLSALNAEIKVFLDRADTQARIKDIGSVADHGTPAQYNAFVQAEIEKFGGIIAREKLQMDIN